MKKFKECIGYIFESEGGYVNHPEDPGGHTNMGITLASYRSENPDATPETIKKLTKKQATDFYYKKYWLESEADLLPTALALIYFDMAVNAGITTSKKLLQRSLGIAADGIFGPKTKESINNMDIDYTLWRYNSERVYYYANLCCSSPDDTEELKHKKHTRKINFLKGWLNRSEKTFFEALNR